MSRFVSPQDVRLPLSDGDYLIVKARLNMGDTVERNARALTPDGQRIDPLKWGPAVVQAYLLDWSLTDESGRLVPIRDESPEMVAAALRNLDPDDFKEIVDAIEAHEARMTAAREEKKRARTGATTPEASSRSLVAVGGGMSGSEN